MASPLDADSCNRMIGRKIDGLSALHTDQIVAEFAIGIDRSISPATVYRVDKYKNSIAFGVTAC